MEKSEKATVLTAVGAMLIPLAMVWALEAPRDIPSFFIYPVALIVASVGIICILVGWNEIRTGELERREREEEAKIQRKRDEAKRDLEHQKYLLVLEEIGNNLGIRIGILRIKLRRLEEAEKSKEDYGDDGL